MPNARIVAAKERIARFEETGAYEVGDSVNLVGTKLKGVITKVYAEAGWYQVKVPGFGEMNRQSERFSFNPPYAGPFKKKAATDKPEPLGKSDGFPVVYQRKDNRVWPPADIKSSLRQSQNSKK